MEEIIDHPKVFISYSWDTEEEHQDHKNWVCDLATKLRLHGVDVILDQLDLRLGYDLLFYGTETNNFPSGNLYMQ